MKSAKIVSCGLVGISVLILSCSNALSGVRQDVDKNIADIADIKAIIGGLPDLEKRVAALEKLVAEQQEAIAENAAGVAENKDAIAQNAAEIAGNKAEIARLQAEIDALKKLIADLANAPKSQLACVTGMFTAGAMDDPVITSQMNTSINDPYEVFNTFDDPDAHDHPWGLLCNDGWINTGCSQRNEGKIETTHNDLDVMQADNGCSSDNDEYGELWLYTTCCKMIDNQQQ